MLRTLLALAAFQGAHTGPAILIVYTYMGGYQFVQFSSFARCEAVRQMLQKTWENGPKGPNPPEAVCVEG